MRDVGVVREMKRSLAQTDRRSNAPQGARRSFLELEVARLRQDLERTRQRLAQAEKLQRATALDLEHAKERIVALEEENQGLRDGLAAMTERAVTAEKQLKVALEKNKANSTNSHKPPSSDGPANTPTSQTKGGEPDKQKSKGNTKV